MTVSAEFERGLENVYILAFDSVWTGLVIVTCNVYSLCEVCYIFNFRTIPLIVQKLLINAFHRIRMPEMKLFNFVRIIHSLRYARNAFQELIRACDYE